MDNDLNFNWLDIMNEMMSTGIELMLTGMGIVYAFLAMLVFAIKIMTAMVTRYFPEVPTEFTSSPVNTSNEQLVTAAITAAVHQYRSKHKKTT